MTGGGARQREGTIFGTAAAAYAEHRPGYAEDAVGWALEPVAGRRPLRVLDLGAGTGKLTAALARRGAGVTAVDPDPAMLAELRRALPGVPALAGSAEDIPLPDGSVDAVLAGQAIHWFDMDRAAPEIMRVLAPGGVAAGLWNVLDDRESWVAGLAEVAQGKGGVTLSEWREENRDHPLQRLGVMRPGMFTGAELAEFRAGQWRTADSLTATVATHSALLLMDEAGRNRLLAAVRAYLRSRPQTSAGKFLLPLVTVAARIRRAA
jgi:SAM-dependent methyltransferase